VVVVVVVVAAVAAAAVEVAAVVVVVEAAAAPVVGQWSGSCVSSVGVYSSCGAAGGNCSSSSMVGSGGVIEW
jgi:hypothetical protein